MSLLEACPAAAVVVGALLLHLAHVVRREALCLTRFLKDPVFHQPFWAQVQRDWACRQVLWELPESDKRATAPKAMARGERASVSNRTHRGTFSFHPPMGRQSIKKIARHLITDA